MLEKMIYNIFYTKRYKHLLYSINRPNLLNMNTVMTLSIQKCIYDPLATINNEKY